MAAAAAAHRGEEKANGGEAATTPRDTRSVYKSTGRVSKVTSKVDRRPDPFMVGTTDEERCIF